MPNIMKLDIGKSITMDIDIDAYAAAMFLHTATRDQTIKIALKNMCGDAHASVTEKSHPDPELRKAAALALANKKFAALMAGDVRTNVGAPRVTASLDPVSAEALRLARRDIGLATRGWENGKAAAWFIDAAKVFNMPFADASHKKALIARAISEIAKHPAVVKKAQENVADFEMPSLSSLVAGLIDASGADIPPDVPTTDESVDVDNETGPCIDGDPVVETPAPKKSKAERKAERRAAKKVVEDDDEPVIQKGTL